MGWISALYETYNNASKIVGKIDNDGTVLLPISHSTQNAQIEIIINQSGDFIRAIKVDKTDAVTIIPVTENSASRGNGVNPHPLCDKLCYIAGDYMSYFDEKDFTENFEAYIKQLKNWYDSEYNHEKVIAIYNYLARKTVITDLIQEKVLEYDDKGILSDKVNKMHNIAQMESFVRFSIEKEGLTKYQSKTWLDTTLYDSYIHYYSSTKIVKDMCYITGEIIPCSDKHPSKIRHTGDKAKLISANDTSGYTYRGRFVDKSEVVSVGYETSQKAHNALRWLIKKQGYTLDGAAIVAWAVNGTQVPKVTADTDDAFFDEPEDVFDTAKSYADRLSQAINGYKSDLITATKIVVMSVDAATTGRLSITYYRELDGSNFLKRIQDWHLVCSWKHDYKKKDDSYYSFVGAPSPREIALTAFGIDQNGLLKASEKLIRTTVERLLPCILDGAKIPYDIVYAAVNNAGRPMAMSRYNWRRVLSNTCAMVKKYRYDKYEKEEWSMALDVSNQDRSYLFGRLLAIADRVEFRTYERGEKRETNAKRYMSVFSKRPAKTWKIIYEKLIPYFNKLSIGEKVMYQNLVEEIGALFNGSDFDNKSLSELYLLGFYCQGEHMKSKHDKQEINDMEEESNE